MSFRFRLSETRSRTIVEVYELNLYLRNNILYIRYSVVLYRVTGNSVSPDESSVIAVVPGYRCPDGGRVFADGRFVYGGVLAVAPRPVSGAQPTREYDEQLKHDERDQHQCERVRVPVRVLVARRGGGCGGAAGAGEVDLVTGVAPLGFKFELVLDADLLEDDFFGLVTAANATSAAPPAKKKRDRFKSSEQNQDLK